MDSKLNKIILYNAIKTPDGTILNSLNRHDYVDHVDKNGEYYFNDGGISYLRRSINKETYEDLTIYDDESHENRRIYLKWGSNYDEDMVRLPKTIYRTIENMDTSHIKAVLDGNWCKSELYLKVFNDELKFREGNKDVPS